MWFTKNNIFCKSYKYIKKNLVYDENNIQGIQV